MIRQVSLLPTNGVGGVVQLSFSHFRLSSHKRQGACHGKKKKDFDVFLDGQVITFFEGDLEGGGYRNALVKREGDYF